MVDLLVGHHGLEFHSISFNDVSVLFSLDVASLWVDDRLILLLLNELSTRILGDLLDSLQGKVIEHD